MFTDDTPGWITEARRLFPELLDTLANDPVRQKKIDDVLAFFPGDGEKIAFLRFAHDTQIAPDDPAIHTIVQFLSVLLYLNEHRLEPSVKNITDAIATLRDGVHEANGDMRKYTRLLVREAEKIADGAKVITTASEELKSIVASIGTTLDDASAKRLDLIFNAWQHLLTDRTAAAIKEQVAPIVSAEILRQSADLGTALTEASSRVAQLTDTTVKMRDALVPAVAAVNEMTKSVPYIDRWVKIPRRDARVAAITAVIALFLGGLGGYQLHQQTPSFTVTKDVLQAMENGGYMMAVKDKLDPTTRKKLDALIRANIGP